MLQDMIGYFATDLQFIFYLVQPLFCFHALGRGEIKVCGDKRDVAVKQVVHEQAANINKRGRTFFHKADGRYVTDVHVTVRAD